MWNHRVVRYKTGAGDIVYQFAEVYYTETGDFSAWSDPFMHADTPAELRELATRLVVATTRPILDVKLDYDEDREEPFFGER